MVTPSSKGLRGSEQFQEDCTSENFFHKTAVSQNWLEMVIQKRDFHQFCVNSGKQD